MNRIVRVLIVAVALAGAGRIASAADYPGPHEAGPTIYTKVFENERIRVSVIKFEPGESIPMHHHSYDHELYILEAGQLTITKPDGTVSVVDAKVGDVMFMGMEDHEAKNTGPTTFRAVVTEIKK